MVEVIQKIFIFIFVGFQTAFETRFTVFCRDEQESMWLQNVSDNVQFTEATTSIELVLKRYV